MRQIFLDTETTGFSPEEGDRIVEVGCIEYLDREPTGRQLHLYINPERDSSEGALKVHGLTTAFLSQYPVFAQVAQQLHDFIQGAEVVIHNAPFDCGFIDSEFKRCKLPPISQVAAKITDSLVLARQIYPGKANSLDALCKRLEIDNSERQLHGALLDAELLADVFVRMTRGQKNLFASDEKHSTQTSTTQRSARAPLDPQQLSQLLVLEASPDEQAAHTTMLQEINKSSGGRCQWLQSMQ